MDTKKPEDSPLYDRDRGVEKPKWEQCSICVHSDAPKEYGKLIGFCKVHQLPVARGDWCSSFERID